MGAVSVLQVLKISNKCTTDTIQRTEKLMVIKNTKIKDDTQYLEMSMFG